MKDIVIVGAGGFAREVAWLIEEINKYTSKWNLLGFIDDNEELKGKKLNGYEVLGNIDYLNSSNIIADVVIAIGNGKIRENIVKKIKNRQYATLIHPSISISDTNVIGEGCIICASSILTVNIVIKNHVIINLDCTIGHDVYLNDFVTLMPSVNVSGNVKIDKYTTIGTGTNIIQGLSIGENVMIGAGTVMIKNIDSNCTIVGNPGKLIVKEK